MKNIRIVYLMLLFVLCAAIGCTPMDEYKTIAGDSELSYPARIEDAIVYSGKGRVVVKGLFKSDPKVVKCRIYWNLMENFMDIPVDMSGGSQLLDAEILLPEKSYSFDIFTYDAVGNRSVPVNVSGKSYGEKYRATIGNRLIDEFLMVDGVATIEWFQIDMTAGPVSTEVTYMNTSNQEVTVSVPPVEQTTVLNGYKAGTTIKYFTRFKPDERCLDIFDTESDTRSM